MSLTYTELEAILMSNGLSAEKADKIIKQIRIKQESKEKERV